MAKFRASTLRFSNSGKRNVFCVIAVYAYVYLSCSLWNIILCLFTHECQDLFLKMTSGMCTLVYELVVESFSGKQQCACFCSECGWSSEAPHTVSPSWSLERYLQTTSLWVYLAVYLSVITLQNLNFILYQILPGVRIIIANPETKGPLGDSHLGEVSSFCRIKVKWK